MRSQALGALRYQASPTTGILVLITGVAYGVAFVNGALLAHLIGSLLLTFVGLSYALARGSLDGVSISRAVAGTAFDGDDVEVHFTVSNGGKTRRALIEVTNPYYATHTSAGLAVAFVTELGPGASASVSTSIKDLRRGEYVFSPPVLASGDPFGLFTARREIDELEFPDPRLTVFPRPFPIE